MKRKRVLIGSCAHESNTFNPLKVVLADFSPLIGQDLYTCRKRDSLAGIIAELRSRGCGLVPALSAHAMPGGRVERGAFEELRRALISAAAGVDGVCLFLHGAMRAEGEDYGDAALIEGLRQTLGADVPVVLAMDMHANITTTLVQLVDALVTYKTAPHIDTYETGLSRTGLREDRRALHPES